MKLTELDPKLFAIDGRHGQGMIFQCPHCRRELIAVAFANPIDCGEPFPIHKFEILFNVFDKLYDEKFLQYIVPPGYLWTRIGEDFESMTIQPSVDASASGHWHGFIIDGEVR